MKLQNTYQYLIKLLDREIGACGLDTEAGNHAFIFREQLKLLHRDGRLKILTMMHVSVDDSKAARVWREGYKQSALYKTMKGKKL